MRAQGGTHDHHTTGAFFDSPAAAAIALTSSDRARASNPPRPFRAKDRLIVRSPRPINLEARLGRPDRLPPPDEGVLRRNTTTPHGSPRSRWSVKSRSRWTTPSSPPGRSAEAFHVHAGRDPRMRRQRSSFLPQAAGLGHQWENGAVGNAAWKACGSADVLSLARPRPTGRHVAFDGLTSRRRCRAPDFIRASRSGRRSGRTRDRARDERQTGFRTCTAARRARSSPGSSARVRQVARADHRPPPTSLTAST